VFAPIEYDIFDNGQTGVIIMYPEGPKILWMSVDSGLRNDASSLALSICLRFAMQVFICDRFLDFIKFGTAIAAMIPIIATVIMISIKVKPLVLIRVNLLLMFSL